MKNPIRVAALLALQLASTASIACSISFVSSVRDNPQQAIEHSTAIFAGRATSIREEQSEAVIARLEIDTVFKGRAPRVLVFRARHLDHPCGGMRPPETEPFYAFVRFESGNIQTPDWIGFVPQSAVSADFVRSLGKATAPGAPPSPLLARLAPPTVPGASIRRSEGEVTTESWIVQFDRNLWHWDRQPRFYLRYPHATFLLEPGYVLEKVAQWPHKELIEAVRRSLPLTESVDLYKYQLNAGRPELTDLIDKLAVEATIEGRTQILFSLGCCLRTVQVNRSSLGTQSVSNYETELVRAYWKPEPIGDHD